MSNLNRHPVRRTAAGVLAGALALSGALSAGILPANAAAGFGFDRLAGNDRYETSAAIAARYRALAGTGTGTSAPGTVTSASRPAFSLSAFNACAETPRPETFGCRVSSRADTVLEGRPKKVS